MTANTNTKSNYSSSPSRVIVFSIVSTILLSSIFGLTIQTFGDENNQTYDNEWEQIEIVTTVFPIYDFVTHVGGERTHVTMLMPQGTNVHNFDFTPEIVMKIMSSDLLIYNGAGLEPGITSLQFLQNEGLADLDNTILVDTSTAVNVFSYVHFGDGSAYSLRDPHIWLNPENAIAQIKLIRDTLVSVDPEHEEYYNKNSNDYISQIQALDQEFQNIFSQCSSKKFITVLPAYGYLAHHYGLEQISIVSYDYREPQPDAIIKILDLIKENNMAVIYDVPSSDKRIAQNIISEMGIGTVVDLDHIEFISTDDFTSGKNYLQIMHNNLSNLEKGLSCNP